MTMENLRTKLIYTAVVYYLFLQLVSLGAQSFGVYHYNVCNAKPQGPKVWHLWPHTDRP